MAAYGLCEVCSASFAFVLLFDTDGGSKLQRTTAVEKEKKRGLQWRDWRGGEAGENSQVYCGESAVCFSCHWAALSLHSGYLYTLVHVFDTQTKGKRLEHNVLQYINNVVFCFL